MPILSATTTRCDMTGWLNTCSIRLRRSRIMQPGGYIRTIMSAPTWVWVELPRFKNWPWWPDVYFWKWLKMGVLPSLLSGGIGMSQLQLERSSLPAATEIRCRSCLSSQSLQPTTPPLQPQKFQTQSLRCPHRVASTCWLRPGALRFSEIRSL